MNVLQGAPLDSKFCPSRTIYYEFYFLNFKVKKYLLKKKKNLMNSISLLLVEIKEDATKRKLQENCFELVLWPQPIIIKN